MTDNFVYVVSMLKFDDLSKEKREFLCEYGHLFSITDAKFYDFETLKELKYNRKKIYCLQNYGKDHPGS